MPKFLSSIDLSNLELSNFLVQNLPNGTMIALTDRAGQMIYDSSNNYLNWNDGSGFNRIYKSSASRVENTNVLRDGSGNHSATTLENSRNFQISGKATASNVAFDGSGNVNLVVTALSAAASEITLANGKFLIGTSGGVAEEVSKTDIPLSGFGNAQANVSLGGYKLTSVGTPTASTDAATKAYVDSTASGLSVKDSVKYATTADLTYSTYSYPSLDTAVGARMISAPGATLTVDGANPSIGDRVLVKNDANADRNGIYERTADDGTSWVLTRATDFDENSEVSAGDFVFVTDGSTNASTGWALSTFDGTLSVSGTAGDDLVFTQFSGAGTYQAGNGIVVDGTDIHFAKSSSYTIGDIFYADTSTSVDTIAAVATGNALISGGVGTSPSWGKIGLTTHVSGTLAVGNGGVGITSYTAGDILFAASSDTLSKLTLGSSNEVLKVSGGEPTWGSVAFSELTGYLAGSQMPALSGDVSSTEGSGVITVEKVSNESIANAANLPDFVGLKSFSYGVGSSGYPDSYVYGQGIYSSRLATESTERRGSFQLISKSADEVQWYLRKVINAATNEWSPWYKIWHEGNDGSGSGLDADKLDNLQATSFLRSDASTVFNESGANIDFRIEGQSDENLFFSDSSLSRIAIGTSSPTDKLHINGSQRIENGSLYFKNSTQHGFIPFPDGAWYKGLSELQTGAIKITLPVHGTFDMVTFWVDINDYSTNESVSLYISGFIFQETGGDEWNNETAIVFTKDSAKNYTVRFGADGTNTCIWIGELTSTWSHPQIVVRDFQGGYDTNIESYKTGWSIDITGSFDTVNSTISGNFPQASNADTLDGQHGTYYLPAGNISGTDNYIPMFNGTSAIENSVIYQNSSFIGIKTTSPRGILDVSNNNTDTNLYISTYSTTDEHNSNVGFLRSKNSTIGALTTTVTNDIIGGLDFLGVNTGNTPAPAASISVKQVGSAGASYVPSRITLSTYSSSVQNTNQLVLNSDGNIGIGTNSPSEKLDVSGNTKSSQFISTITGESPFVVSSDTLVNNLNSDLLDDNEGSYYLNLGNSTGILTSDKGGLGANFSSITAGTILVGKGDGDFNAITAGASGTYLQSQGTANPSWVTPSINEFSGILTSDKGGTENGYFKVAGPATTEKTYTFQNKNSIVPSFFTDSFTTDGTSTTFEITHNLGTRNIVPSVIDDSSKQVVYPTIDFNTDNTVQVIFGSAGDSGLDYNVVLIGY